MKATNQDRIRTKRIPFTEGGRVPTEFADPDQPPEPRKDFAFIKSGVSNSLRLIRV